MSKNDNKAAFVQNQRYADIDPMVKVANSQDSTTKALSVLIS